MLITDIKPASGSRRKTKRVGRGRASGHGKTSTRGHNGQGQRSGESKRFGFEGGQTPLFRRLPKIHNFDAVQTCRIEEVNVGALNVLAPGQVDAVTLVQAGILRKDTGHLRILGNGELKVALQVRAQHFSAGAKKKIEEAGGSIDLIVPNDVSGKRDKRVDKAIAKKNSEKAAAQQERNAALEKKKEKEAGVKQEAQPAKSTASKGKSQGGEKPSQKPSDKHKPVKKTDKK